MTDAAHFLGSDLNLSATGDLLIVDGSAESLQRVLRRLLTNPTQYDTGGDVAIAGDYLWQPGYGAGLPSDVGAVLDVPSLTALIKAQMYLEADVAHDPEPQILLRPIADGVSAQITYTSRDSGQPASLSFSVTS